MYENELLKDLRLCPWSLERARQPDPKGNERILELKCALREKIREIENR